jgi:hypothetical protein
MFTLAALVFAIVIGFFMSLTITLGISLLKYGWTGLIGHWVELWLIVYPLVIVCIVLYRPLSLNISGRIIKKWQSRHSVTD